MTENEQNLEQPVDKKIEKKTQQNALKKQLWGILLEVQDEYKKQWKVLTVDNAMDALTNRLESSFKTKDLLGQLAQLLNKEKITFNDIANVELDWYKTLQWHFSNEYFSHLDATNKWWTISAYVDHMKSTLKPVQGSWSKSFSKFLWATWFPQFNTETRRWEVDWKEHAWLPVWNKNYFVQLRNHIDGYVDYLEDRWDAKSFEKVVDSLQSKKLKMSKIVSHFVKIGLYDWTTITKNTILWWVWSRVIWSKKYSKAFRKMIDPKNLISWLTEMHIASETSEIMEDFSKEENTLLDYFTNRWWNINKQLLEKYPIMSFKKIVKNSWIVNDFKRFEREYYYRCIGNAKKTGDKKSETLAESMIWILSGKESLPDDRVNALRSLVMETMLEQKLQLAKSSWIYDHLKRVAQKNNPTPSTEMIDKYISTHEQFWKDFYNLDQTEHTLVDSQWTIQKFNIEKNLVFSPDAKEWAKWVADLFHLELSYKPEFWPDWNLNVMTAMWLEDVWSIDHKIERHPKSLDQKLLLQKSQRYRLHGPEWELVEWYVQVTTVGDHPTDPEWPVKYTIRMLDEGIDTFAIDDSIWSFPFWKDWADNISSLTNWWSFETIDTQWNSIDPVYKVKLPLSSSNDREWSLWKHLTRLEKISLMMPVEQSEAEKIPLENYKFEEFDWHDLFENLEEKRLNESQEKLKKRYLKTKVSNEIPQALKDKTESDDIHAWIDNWEIFLYHDHFKKPESEWWLWIDLLDKNLWLVDDEWYIDMSRVNEWVDEAIIDPKEYTKRRTILLEIRKLTVHEKAHRIFHYYGITDWEIAWLTTDESTAEKIWALVVHPYDDPSKELLLSNETLAEISEWRLFKNEKNEQVLKNIPIAFRYIKVDDWSWVLQDAVTITWDDNKEYTVLISHIEETIRQKDHWLRNFTFESVLDVDERIIDDLVEWNHPIDDVFAWLLEARSDRQLESEITRETVDQNAWSAVYLFPDNIEDNHRMPSDRIANTGLAWEIAWAANAIWIPLWFDSNTPFETPMSAVESKRAKKSIKKAIKKINKAIAAWKRVVLPTNEDWSSTLWNELAANPNAQDALDYLNGALKEVDHNLSHEQPEDQNTPNEAETPEQTRERNEGQEVNRQNAEHQAFDDWYNNLDWDPSLTSGPEVGHAIMIRDWVSTWPAWWSDRVRVDIVAVEDDKIKVQLVWHSEKNANWFLWDIYDIPRTEQWIQKLKDNAKWRIYKYKPQSSKSWFLSYKWKSWLDWWWENVDSSWMKKYKVWGEWKEKRDKVTHVAILPHQIAPYELKRSIYAVERWSSTVTLSTTRDVEVNDKWKTKKQEKIVQTMDYTMFAHFCKDKKLQPYTTFEVDRAKQHKRLDAKKDDKSIAPKSNRRDSLTSLTWIWTMLKKFPETYKVKKEQEAKLQAAELFNCALWKMPGWLDSVWYLWDIKADALAEQDSTAMQIIDDYKWRLTRTDIWEWSHGWLWAKIIKTQIFDKTMKTKSDRLKACWYFLFAIENWWNPYQRALQEYDGKWEWVKAILWEEYQKDFVKEQDKLIDLLQSAAPWEDTDAIQDRLAKLEMHYICTRTLDHPFFWSRFARAVEGHMDKWWKIDALDWVKQWVWAKWSFYEIYNWFQWWGIGNMLPHVYMWSILAMEEAIETEEHYQVFYQSIVITLVSWFSKTFSKRYMDTFKGICRRNGIPIWMFVSDPNWSQKATDVIDYVAKKSWIKPTLSEMLWKALDKPGQPWDPSKLNVKNYNNGKQVKKVKSVIESRWWSYGQAVMDSFNYKEDYLLEWLADRSSKADVVKEYFGPSIVFNWYRDYKEWRGWDMKDWDNPVYDGIFNLSPGTFESYMLWYNGRGFNADKSYEMREKFWAWVWSFESIMKQANSDAQLPMLEFLFEKFTMYFGKVLWDTWLYLLRRELLEWGDWSVDNIKKIAAATLYNDNSYSINEDTKEIEERNNPNYQIQWINCPAIVKQTMDRYIALMSDWMRSLRAAVWWRWNITNDIINELVNTKLSK